CYNAVCGWRSEARAVEAGARSTLAGETIGRCTPAELAELAFPEVGVLDETPCAICLDVIAPEDPARKLSCGHAFHASCVSSWWKCSLQQSRAQVSCPSCRVEVAVNISTALVEQQEQQLQLSTGPADEEEESRVRSVLV
ncbi:unnamed protein product, partial [Polarella glacialis]